MATEIRQLPPVAEILLGLRPELAVWFAYQILEGRKFEVDYSWDPPWDCSGHLKTSGNLSLADYNQLFDFLDEYSGNSRPSFVSGCGMFHDSYRDDLTEVVSEHLWSLVRAQTPTDLTNEEQDALTEDYADLICEIEGDLFDQYKDWSCQTLFDEGEFEARRQIKQKEKEQQERLEEQQRQLTAARTLVKERFGHLNLEGQITKQTASWSLVAPILQEMTPEERRLAALVLPTSNRIREDLAAGEMPKWRKGRSHVV